MNGYDQQGNWVIKPKFDDMWPFKKGEEITAFRLGKAWGFTDREGKIVLEPRYRGAGNTFRGITPVRVGTGSELSYGFVTSDGRWVVPPRFYVCGEWSGEGIIGVEIEAEGYWGLVDQKGNWIIEPKYTFAAPFHDGLGRVYVGGGRDIDRDLIDGKFGYINTKDELVIPAVYDDADDFHDGVACVRMFDKENDENEDDEEVWLQKSGWIDREGKYIWEPTR